LASGTVKLSDRTQDQIKIVYKNKTRKKYKEG
jgi:hypothetical protein